MGWCDAGQGWYRLIQGGQNYLLDQSPLLDSNVEVLLRSIDLITMARPKALLWQAGVRSTGGNETGSKGGALIVSGLNLLVSVDTTCCDILPHRKISTNRCCGVQVNDFSSGRGCPKDFP